ncbi:MAG: hypothetical protein R2772_07420 [Chitinophagales bacterium]
MKRTISIPTILLLIGIFLVSVLIRIPNLNRPLSKHHEFVSAVSLRVMSIWEKDGAWKYRFNPVMSYPNEADKYINNWASTTGEMLDKEGNYYYVSHPPFAYILPYAFFQLLHLKVNVLNLQIFHLLVNFICALFIYLIVCLLGEQKPFARIYWSGIVGYLVYLFSAGVLWFQSNTYMSDMLVHLFFVLSVYTMLKLLMRKKFFSPKYLVLYAIFLFLMIYTSWLGLFFAFSVFLYSFIKLRKEKVFIPLNLITLLVSVAALALFIYQYSLIAGFDVLKNQLLNRLGERGSLSENTSLLQQLKHLAYLIYLMLKGYITSYFPLFLLLVGFVYLTITRAKLRIVFTKNGYRFLWLSTLPVILLHFFLLNYSGHDFVSLYGSLFLSVLIAILYDKLKKAQTLSNYQLNGGITALVLLSILSYFYINKPGAYSFKNDYYAQSMDLGEQVKTEAKKDQVVFILGKLSVDPQLIYYAERNIVKITSKEEAFAFLKQRKLVNGIVFHYDQASANSFTNIENITWNE